MLLDVRLRPEQILLFPAPKINPHRPLDGKVEDLEDSYHPVHTPREGQSTSAFRRRTAVCSSRSALGHRRSYAPFARRCSRRAGIGLGQDRIPGRIARSPPRSRRS